jgi:hypothetical protein
MSRLAWLGSSALVLTLASACTSHGGDEPIEHEREPDPPPPIELIPATPPPVAEPVVRGPTTPLTRKPFTGAIGDVTGDGQVDVVALCHDPQVAALIVLHGAPDGTFVEGEPLIVEASGIALGDLDGDGDLDALLTNARGKPAYRIAINDGTGSFELGPQRSISGRYGGELRGPSLIDLDGDGRLDAVIPLWDSIRVMPGKGAGELGSGKALSVGRDPLDTALCDLDGDGLLDLVATSGAAPARDRDSYESSGASAWIFMKREQGFAEPIRVEIAGALEIELGDLDDDGKLEIVVSGSGGLTVIRVGLGEPRVERIPVATDGPLLLADILDPPGLELITSSYMQSRIHALAGYPNPQKTSFEAGNFVVGLYAADVARDGGRSDVVVLNAGPPGGQMGAPAPSIEVLLVAR